MFCEVILLNATLIITSFLRNCNKNSKQVWLSYGNVEMISFTFCFLSDIPWSCIRESNCLYGIIGVLRLEKKRFIKSIFMIKNVTCDYMGI